MSAAKNQEQPSNSKVLMASMLFTAAIAALILCYVIVNTILDQPFSFLAEECARTTRADKEIRPVPMVSILVFQGPNLFNVLSLIIDLWLVCFFRNKVLPAQAEVITTVSGQLTTG